MNYDMVGNDPAGRELIDSAMRALERERPDIAVDPIDLIDMGFSSYVLATGSNFIVRIARTAEAAASHVREHALLRELPRQVSVEAPLPVWRIAAGPDSRHGAMAYKRIAGESLRRDRPPGTALLDQLTRFLVAVHQVRDPVLMAVVTPFEAWRDGIISLARASVEQLAHDLPKTDHERLRHWFAHFARSVGTTGLEHATFVHGDFWHANILTCDEQLTGMLDWESAAIADPAVDLAPVWDIDQELGASLARRYQELMPDPTLDERIHLFRVARNIGGVIWSINNDDPAEYADSLTKVHSVLPLI